MPAIWAGVKVLFFILPFLKLLTDRLLSKRTIFRGAYNDQISQTLHNDAIDNKKLYFKGKRLLKSIKVKGKNVILVDDSVVVKPHTTVNSLVAYHYNHSQHNYVKGINIISAVWGDERYTVSLSVEAVKKELV